MSNLSSSVSNFGFGCSGLMARLNLRESIRLLEHAYDAGITYFDVARSYGYGAAEKAVGIFSQGKRDRLTIATKFGILPPRRSFAFGMAKKAARLLVSLHPTLRDRLRARAAALVERSSFGIERARNSFETSLRELRMDQVDVVLLHECEPQNLQDEALRQLLQEWLRQGLAKSIGIATCHNTIEWALHTQPHEHRVYQFANAPSNPFRSSLLADRTVVTHSALREDLPRIMQSLREETFAKQWSRDLDLDATRDEVAALLLSWAVRRYGGGRVLFSTSRGETIGKTLGRTLALAQDAQRIAAFEKLLAVGR